LQKGCCTVEVVKKGLNNFFVKEKGCEQQQEVCNEACRQ
jgi:hypothetical protein